MDAVATSIAFTEINLPNAMPAESLAMLSTHANKTHHKEWLKSLQTVLQERHEEDIVVITGSLYFIAEARQWLQEEGQ